MVLVLYHLILWLLPSTYWPLTARNSWYAWLHLLRVIQNSWRPCTMWAEPFCNYRFGVKYGLWTGTWNGWNLYSGYRWALRYQTFLISAIIQKVINPCYKLSWILSLHFSLFTVLSDWPLGIHHWFVTKENYLNVPAILLPHWCKLGTGDHWLIH